MLVATLQKLFPLPLLILVTGTDFAQQTKADVLKECVNYTTCIETYADMYSALASPRNYFNIALALYPARKPSSVLVHVNLHIFNQTGTSAPVPYTWSMSCLYAAFPATVVEILSLGSILITSRKRGLNITIEPFCCKVSEEDRIIIIDRVLAELQDLAVSPKLEDPTLNTAECVIQGHEPDISATGRSAYIRAVLWCSLTFTTLFGPLAALIIFIGFDIAKKDETQHKKKKQNLCKAVKYTSYIILAVEILLLIVTIIVCSVQGNVPWDTYVIVVLITVEGLLMGLALRKKSFPFLPENETLGKVGIFLWTNLTMYYFCWLVIGIMINPLWGFTVFLVICVVIAATVFVVYQFISFYDPQSSCKRNLAVCGACLCSIFSLVTVMLLAGQSFFGRETANDVVKITLLYVTTAFVSWILAKIKKEGKADKSKKTIPVTEEENTPLAEVA